MLLLEAKISRFEFKTLRILKLFRISIFEFRICAENFRLFYPEEPTKDFVRNFQQILQNEPNFPHFSPENEDSAKKRTQIFNPNV